MTEIAFGLMAVIVVGVAVLAVSARLTRAAGPNTDLLGLCLWWYGTAVLFLGMLVGAGGLAWSLGFLLLGLSSH